MSLRGFLKDFSKQFHWAILNHGFELQIPFVYLYPNESACLNYSNWSGHKVFLEMTVEIPKGKIPGLTTYPFFTSECAINVQCISSDFKSPQTCGLQGLIFKP